MLEVAEARQFMGLQDDDAWHGMSALKLKRVFREQSLRVHPDVGGSDSEFVRLQEAYKALRKHVPSDVKAGRIDPEAKTVEGIPLTDLGHGYPINESAKTCESCDGKGYMEYTLSPKVVGHEKVSCLKCDGVGLFSYPCKFCSGTGEYDREVWNKKLGKKEKVVVGKCRRCNGTGRFYPENKRRILVFRVKIPGTDKPGIPCSECYGDGFVNEPVYAKDGDRLYHRCSTCDGKGEVKMWNPVIPRGFFRGAK